MDGVCLTWPMEGKVLPGSTRVHLLLDQDSLLMYPGMVVTVVDGQDDGALDQAQPIPVAVLSECRRKVTLAEALPFDPVGMAFIASDPFVRDSDTGEVTFEVPPPPQNPRDWSARDVANVLNYLEETVVTDGGENGHNQPPRVDFAWQCGILSRGEVKLDADCTPGDVDAAWTETRRWLEMVTRVAEDRRVLGRDSEDQLIYAQTMQKIKQLSCTAFEALFAFRTLENQKTAVRSNLDLDEIFVNPWWYTTDQGQGGKSDTVVLIQFLLVQAKRQNIRKSVTPDGKIAFIMQEVTQDMWEDKPLGCFGPCTGEPQCRGRATWGVEEQGGQFVMRTCQAHAEVGARDLRLNPDGTTQRQYQQRRVIGTKAWRVRMKPDGQPYTVSDWVHETVNRTIHPELWFRLLTSYGSTSAACVNYLTSTSDSCFPVVYPDPYYYSFQNGVLDIKRLVFYPLRPKAGEQAPPDVCSANFIDAVCDPALLVMPAASITVPGYDDLLACQHYSREMVQWMDAFLGRLFFKVGEFERWEKLMVIKGWAATGKSTIAKAISILVGEMNVGFIATNCEEQWALANIYNKRMWMCLELKSGFKLPTGVMQSMVSGERVVVNIKNRTAFDVLWSQQGLLVGNEIPITWTADVANALARRVTPFPFDIAPSTQDPFIATNLMKNIARMFVRCIRQYREKAQEVQERDVDQFLPKELKAATAAFKERSAPIQRFIKGSDDLEVADECIRNLILYGLVTYGGAQIPVLGISSTDMEALKAKVRELVEEQGQDIVSHANLEALMREWSVTMNEFQQRYRTWCANTAVVAKIDVSNSETYKYVEMTRTEHPVTGARGTMCLFCVAGRRLGR